MPREIGPPYEGSFTIRIPPKPGEASAGMTIGWEGVSERQHKRIKALTTRTLEQLEKILAEKG